MENKVKGTRYDVRNTGLVGIGNSSAQDFAFTAKSVRTCKFDQEGICPSPKATWKN